MNLHVIRSILVYNYGIAHRCCTPAPALTSTTPTDSQSNQNHHNSHHNSHVNNNKVGTFCLQIFQYAEQLLIPALERHTNACIHFDAALSPSSTTATTTTIATEASAAALSSAPNQYLLLYRFILTRNLMMISCKMGMLLCELYKQTLDPIESEILLLTPPSPQPQPSQRTPTITTDQQDEEGNTVHQHDQHYRSNTETNDTLNQNNNASAA